MSVESKVKRVKERYSLEILSKFMVLGVGIATKVIGRQDTGEPCIKVYVTQKLPDKFLLRYGKDFVISPEIEGVQTDVVEMFEIRYFETVDLPPERRKRLRPAPSGCSVSHYAVNGRGTLGCWAKDKKTGEPLLLSCWHVIANKGMCLKGDPILQPGRLDGGKLPDDVIAFLERWIDVKMLGPNMSKSKERIRMALDNGIEIPINKVDAALAKPVSYDVVSDEVLGINKPKGGVCRPKRGDKVIGSGATSGAMGGVIGDVDIDIFVSYPPLGIALFKNQIRVTAGSSYGLINPAEYSEDLMNVQFVWPDQG